jgi:rod shape-determining protein MreC
MRDNRRTRVVLALLLLTAFTLITLDIRGGSGSGLRGFGQRVFGPVERAASAVVRPITDFIDGLTNISSNADKIAALEADNQRRHESTSDAEAKSARDQR